jgi:hypothetical protein
MDIASFIPTTDTVEVELKNPATGEVMTNKDESPMTITMYLPHSKQYKEVRHAQTNKRIQENQKKNKKVITAQEIEAETLDPFIAEQLFEGVADAEVFTKN